MDVESLNTGIHLLSTRCLAVDRERSTPAAFIQFALDDDGWFAGWTLELELNMTIILAHLHEGMNFGRPAHGLQD